MFKATGKVARAWALRKLGKGSEACLMGTFNSDDFTGANVDKSVIEGYWRACKYKVMKLNGISGQGAQIDEGEDGYVCFFVEPFR